MDKEQQKKFEFVSCELDALAKKINPDIMSLTYNYSDNLLAITKDVLKHI